MDGVVIVFSFVLEKEMLESAPDGLVKIAAQRIVAQKLHLQHRCADERPKVPGKLRAEKKISAQPGE